MFTHLKISKNTTFTTGEIVSGSTSGATGYVQAISSGTVATISGATQADPIVITATGHEIKDGDAVHIFDVIGMTELNDNTYYVKVVDNNSFSLHDSAGNNIDSSGFTSYTSAGTASTGTVILSSVEGLFNATETITGQISNNTAVVKADLYGNTGVQNKEFAQTKQIGMAGSPTYTADTSLSTSYGGSTQLSGNVSISNSSSTLYGNGTKFLTELRPRDSITWLDDANTTTTALIQRVLTIISKNLDGKLNKIKQIEKNDKKLFEYPEILLKVVEKNYERQELHKVIDNIWKLISEANKYVDESAPWKLIKDNKKRAGDVLNILVIIIAKIAIFLAPIMPETSENILNKIGLNINKLSMKNIKENSFINTNFRIEKPEILFKKLI